VPAPEPLHGHRIVADPAAIDALAAALRAPATLLRFAPDEALVVGLGGVALDDPHAIVEPETGFVALTVDVDTVRRHTEWQVADGIGAVGQGAIAGVPAKLTSLPDGRALLVVHAAYVDELLDRLR
jgi:hypothetical protein